MRTIFEKIVSKASIHGKAFRKKNIEKGSNVNAENLFLPGIAMLFVSCLLVANITAQKPITLACFVLPGGSLVFPFSYIFANILTEVYGYKWARFVIWVSIVCNFFVLFYFAIAIVLPSPSYWHDQKAYTNILGFVPIIVFASSVSYLVGEHVNSFILSKLKLSLKGNFLWFRVTASTAIGSITDSIIFIPIVFFKMTTFKQMLILGSSLTFFKVGYEILALPVTYYIIFFLKHAENLDVYDKNTKFTPFSLDLFYSNNEKNRTQG